MTSFVLVQKPEFYLLSFARDALFVRKNVEINLKLFKKWFCLALTALLTIEYVRIVNNMALSPT